jgi:spore maturation protein SpmB
LGLDNAATPFGLKAMESMQEVNKDKERASNSQIMFLCLHAAGLTLIPTSIIGYRAAQHSANPADVMLPIIITSFVGTIAALIFVGSRQRINLLSGAVVLLVAGVSALIAALLVYIVRLDAISKIHFTGNLSNAILLIIIAGIVLFSMFHEKIFKSNNTNIFDSFVTGAKDGFTTGVRVLPYMIAMLVALCIFRNSGLMEIVMRGISSVMNFFNVDPQITNAIPVALMRPFSAGGSRGFMLDAMKTFGPDSLSGRLSCLFQGAAETTFYVIALYFGSVNIKDSRYTLSIMLLVDLVCVLTGIVVSMIYF